MLCLSLSRMATDVSSQDVSMARVSKDRYCDRTGLDNPNWERLMGRHSGLIKLDVGLIDVIRVECVDVIV